MNGAVRFNGRWNFKGFVLTSAQADIASLLTNRAESRLGDISSFSQFTENSSAILLSCGVSDIDRD